MSAFILSGPISQILNHVTTYLDELSSNLATKAVQATMQTTLGSVNTNVSTIVQRVPVEVAPKSTLDTVNTNLSTVLTDTADMQPKVNETVEDTREIVVDTREIVGDVNSVLADTAALDARLNATWAGRLNTTISSRLSSCIRGIRVVGGYNLLGSSNSGYSEYEHALYDYTISAVTDYAKCVYIGSCVFHVNPSNYYYSNQVAQGHGRMISNTVLRLYSAVDFQALSAITNPRCTFSGVIVEFY